MTTSTTQPPIRGSKPASRTADAVTSAAALSAGPGAPTSLSASGSKSSAKSWEIATALELVFSGHPLAMWIVDPETLRFLSVNEAAAEKYGYSQEEFLEMLITDITPDKDMRALVDEIASVDDTRRPPFSSQHRVRAGQTIHVELTMHLLRMDGQHR